ncbi:MAG TPA: hypothetical protein VEL28_15055 [Candidatus Binatia bacterium]|nr:hypothetical protein [Candidatus Binatia bacterium]
MARHRRNSTATVVPKITAAAALAMLAGAVMQAAPVMAATTSPTGPFPVTISAPGSCRLDVDITGCSAPAAEPISPITITSGGVELDLDDHAIEGHTFLRLPKKGA